MTQAIAPSTTTLSESSSIPSFTTIVPPSTLALAGPAPVFTTSTVITSTFVEDAPRDIQEDIRPSSVAEASVDDPAVLNTTTSTGPPSTVVIEPEAGVSQSVPMEGIQTSIAEIPPTPEVESDFSDLEEELVQSYIRNFHDNIRTSLSLIMKGLRTPFSSLKMTLTRSVDNIRDIGGSDRAAPFDQMILDFERDVQLWKEAVQTDLSPLITIEIERLEIERQREQENVQSLIDETSKNLESVKTRKETVSADFDAARDRIGALVKDMNEAHNSIEKANKMIEKAKDMIRKAEALLSRSRPIHDSDSQHLEALASEKITLKAEEARVAQELAQARAQLATLTAELPENMKREAVMKAEEEKRRRVLLLEEKLKTYVP